MALKKIAWIFIIILSSSCLFDVSEEELEIRRINKFSGLELNFKKSTILEYFNVVNDSFLGDRTVWLKLETNQDLENEIKAMNWSPLPLDLLKKYDLFIPDTLQQLNQGYYILEDYNESNFELIIYENEPVYYLYFKA